MNNTSDCQPLLQGRAFQVHAFQVRAFQLQRKPRRAAGRHLKNRGKIMVSFAVLLPVILAIIGLIFDGGLLMHDRRHAQNVVDSAASAAVLDIINGKTLAEATATAELCVSMSEGLSDADVTVNMPPESGPFSGRDDYLEVILEDRFESRIMDVVSNLLSLDYSVRATAAAKASTAPAAILVLDKDPGTLTVGAVPLLLPAPYALTAGLEVEGLGQLRVDGSVLVNNQWGGVDENGAPVGEHSLLRRGVACTPLLPLTQVRARDVRVAGGVDTPLNYSHFDQDEGCLKANRLPVPDPLIDLPTPTTASDPANVSDVNRGGVTIVNLPLVPLPTVLQPGVYEWIEVVSGRVIFEPGVYIIRGCQPVTGISLNLLGGEITAEGVMFYITDAHTFSASTGAPDSGDGDDAPPAPGLTALVPSVVIAGTLLNSHFSPLNDANSPFNGMTLYQRRNDRRPMIIAQQNLLLGGSFSGRVYAKWGHLTLIANGVYDASFAVGTMRVVTVLDTHILPTDPLPPARDGYLVE